MTNSFSAASAAISLLFLGARLSVPIVLDFQEKVNGFYLFFFLLFQVGAKVFGLCV
jgi:hypothetical protein